MLSTLPEDEHPGRAGNPQRILLARDVLGAPAMKRTFVYSFLVTRLEDSGSAPLSSRWNPWGHLGEGTSGRSISSIHTLIAQDDWESGYEGNTLPSIQPCGDV